MAIVDCPNCKKKISSQHKQCRHCGIPLGEMSEEDYKRLEIERWRDQVYRATNASYIALTALIIGALWWWMTGDGGWEIPPPIPAVVLIFLGVLGYLIGRGWLLWLRMGRKRPGRSRGRRP
jgi:hypothetical protein